MAIIDSFDGYDREYVTPSIPLIKMLPTLYHRRTGGIYEPISM